MQERFLIGYARVSTEDQDLRLQIEALKRYGVPEDHIFSEKRSGRTLKDRKLFRVVRDMLRPGDRIVIWRLDRLGRSLKELVQVVGMIEDTGADLVSLHDNIDTSSAGGRLYFHIMAAMAQFESDLTSERTKAGMHAKKLADPDFKPGAKPAISGVPARLAMMQKFYDNGDISLIPKFKQRGPDRGQRIGFTLKGRGHLEPIRDALNACDTGDKPIKNTLTISRWLEDGCPGLVLRDEDNNKEAE